MTWINPDGTSDDFNSYGKGGSQHDDECDCARCEAKWARLNARYAAMNPVR